MLLNFLSQISWQFQEIDLEDFPKTRIFITKTQEPLGWIRLEAI
jgi:hypothetical protein